MSKPQKPVEQPGEILSPSPEPGGQLQPGVLALVEAVNYVRAHEAEPLRWPAAETEEEA